VQWISGVGGGSARNVNMNMVTVVGGYEVGVRHLAAAVTEP